MVFVIFAVVSDCLNQGTISKYSEFPRKVSSAIFILLKIT